MTGLVSMALEHHLCSGSLLIHRTISAQILCLAASSLLVSNGLHAQVALISQLRKQGTVFISHAR
jgi:7-keto-8-aminopelargonate synthetase-like enzyme